MSPLVVEVDGRVLRLESDSVLRIGRAIEADVVLTAGSVSRHHAELRPVNGTWVLVDTGSQFGTFVDERPITEHPITGRTVVRCGPAAPGAVLTIVPAELAPPEMQAPIHAPAPPPVLLPALGDEPTMRPQRPITPSGPATPFAPPAAGAPTGVHPLPPSGARPQRSVPPALADGLDQTQVLAGPIRPGPGGAGPAGPVPPRTGPDLLLVAEGREHRFRHPAQITIGRRADSTVVMTDPAASRVHGQVSAVPGGWTYTNVSNEGTFLDGRRVTTTRFDERIQLRLGHPVAGPEVTLVPILSAVEEERRIARKRLGRRLAIGGVVAAALAFVLVLVAGVVVVTSLLSDDAKPAAGLTGEELDRAKAATVKITAESHLLSNPSDTFTYGGSGSIIRSDGLILTNAHVAEPEAEGLVEQYGSDAAIANPEYVEISLTDGMTDANSEPLYRARVIEADGYLDVAVLQIYADAEGNEVSDLDLDTIPIGDSSSLRAGDDVTVLGFPGVAGSVDTISVTRGGISTLIKDPDSGVVAEFDTDARIAPGNSGGMAIDNDAELIGVPTSIFVEGSSQSGRIRSIDVVKDLIADAEDEVG